MKLLILILLSFNSYSFDHTHQKWQKTLDDHLKRNEKQTFFNYGQLKKDNTNFEEYLKSLSSVKLEEYKKFNDNQKLAFLINAYNAFTVKLIIKNYPVKSIKDIGSFFTNSWKIKFFSLLGKEFYLDKIEHEIIRKDFNEPRIHFAVNCASISCPSLLEKAFVADKLNDQLTTAAQNFLMNSNKNYLKNKSIYLSSIFKWYGGDFEKKYGSLSIFLEKYFGPESKSYKIEYLDYDWNLNDYVTKPN